MVNGLVTSKMDYCNSQLIGLPANMLHKLQRVQNMAARFITRTGRFVHISPVPLAASGTADPLQGAAAHIPREPAAAPRVCEVTWVH